MTVLPLDATAYPPLDDDSPIDPSHDLRARRVPQADPSGPELPAEPDDPALILDDTGDDEPPRDDEILAVQSQCTDAANADAFVAEYKRETFLYVAEWEQWIAWDGRRWVVGGGKNGSRDAVVQSVIRVARVRFMTALVRMKDLRSALDKCEPKTPAYELAKARCKAQEKFLKHLEMSQNANKAHACVALLQGRLRVGLGELDTNPWLFNVRNGTVDLRTGKLRDHARDDLLTQMSDVEHDENATCPTWSAFLHTVMGGLTQMKLYLQRLVGYEMTGVIREQCVVFHFGATGSNGKSTFRGTVQTMLGEYAVAAPRGLLLSSLGPPAHPAELARLHGKRFAACAEVGEGDTIDEAKLKDLTGGDIIACRRMNENFWDLKPTHKLDLFGNHKPTIRGTDNAIWRRIKLVPWLVTIADENKDKDLAIKLRGELSGILNWAIDGCLEWQRVGLSEPVEVTEAVGDYRSESDILGAFLRDHCVVGIGERCARKDLRKRYETWCEELGYKAVGARKIAERLRSMGVSEGSVRVGGKPCDGWHGIRLMTDMEKGSFADEVTGDQGSHAWS